MVRNIPVLTTPRLVLRPLDITDAPAVQVVFPRWEIVRYLAATTPWPYPEDGALKFIRDRALPAMEQGREWHWSIRPRENEDQLIGIVRLGLGDHNRGFWLAPEWQGRGLMTEASDRVTDFWFEDLGQSVLRVSKAVCNRSSARISERSGMRVARTEERDYVSGRHLAEIWEITAAEWRNRHDRSGVLLPVACGGLVTNSADSATMDRGMTF